MDAKGKIADTVGKYILSSPPAARGKLRELRAAIRAAAPQAEERISYRMPAYWQRGVLVYFAAAKHHIGFYPTPSGIRNFRKELAGYATSKGAVQFPLDKPLPLAVIRKIVKARVAETLEKRTRP